MTEVAQSKHGGRRVQQCGMLSDKTVCYWCDAEVVNANGRDAIAAFLRVHPHDCEEAKP